MTTPHFTPEELSAWLDGELELDPSQQAHLKACAECTGAVERHQVLRRTARQATPPIPSDAMWREIDARTAGTAPGRSPLSLFDRLRFSLRGKRVPAAGLATGLAMLAIVIVTRPVPAPMEVPSITPPIAEQPPVAATPPAPAAPAAKPSEPPREEEAAATRQKAPKKRPAATERLAQSAEEPAAPTESSAPQPAAPVPPPQKAESLPSAAAEESSNNEGVLDHRRDAAAPRPARTATAPSGRGESRAPAAAAAPMAAEAAELPVARATWTGRAVRITADRESRPAADRIVLSGHVLIVPIVSASPYMATVDGLTRTLTGQTSGSIVEVQLPQEVLRLKP